MLLNNVDISTILQAYRDDEKDCVKLYSNPDMFFEIWSEAFVKKMEEERKKRKQEARRRRKQREETQKETEEEKEKKKKEALERKVVPLWVRA